MKKATAYEIIKELRLKKGFSQKELADKVGLTQQSIALLENGKRKLEFDLFIEIINKLETTNEELSNIINSIFDKTNKKIINVGSVTTEMNFDTDEEADLYLGIISNLEKMNIDGVKETEHYTKYLLSDNRYTKPDEPQE